MVTLPEGGLLGRWTVPLGLGLLANEGNFGPGMAAAPQIMAQQQQMQALQQQQAMQQQEMAAKAAEQERRQQITQQLLAQFEGNPQMQAAIQMNPEAATKFMLEGMRPQKPVTLSPGGMLVDPQTGQPIAQAPFKPAGAASSLGKLRADLDAGLIDQNTYDAAVRKATQESGGPSSEFERMLAASGLPPERQEELRQQRLVSMATKSGWQVESLPGGGFRISQGAAPASANRQDEIREGLDAFGRARQVIGDVRTAIAENASRGGFTGSLQRKLQTGANVIGDLAAEIPLFGQWVQRLSQQVGQELGGFDERMAQFPVEENVLAYALARARKPGGRLNAQDVENARADVTLQGATSVNDVLARLQVIDREFAKAEADYRARLGQDGATKRLRFDAEGNLIQ